MKDQNQLAAWYLRIVWQWANEAQDYVETEYDGHYIEKCEMKKLLQGFKNALREDLQTLGAKE